MNVPGIALLLICSTSSTAAHPGFAASSSEGCAPECKGSCFAGNCLFADNDVDDEDAFRSTQPQQTAQFMPVSFSQTPSGFSAVSPGLPRVLPLTMPARETTGPAALQSEEVQESKAQELSAELQRATQARAEAHQTEELSAELQRAQANEALLRVQNGRLRQQLYDWKLAGTNVAQREAKVMALLGSQSPELAAALPAVAASAPSPFSALETAVSGAATPVLHPSSFLGSARQRLERTSLSHIFFNVAVAIFVIGAFVNTWLFIQRYRTEDEGSFVQRWSKAIVKSPKSQHLQPVLRAMGLVEYKVEVSEIHLGSLFAGSSDIRVNFRMGNGAERRTQVLKNADGTFLRFDDIIELSISGTDSPCTICVTDRRGDLAHVELAAAHMVKLASRPHQEYFRTELTARRELGDLCGRRPYVAMRMRKKAAASGSAAAEAGHCQRSSEKKVYGSFAV